MVYSADTGPCDRLVRFAHNSDILIHECSLPASQESRGHSSGRQAGKVAQLAHVKKLILVHLPAFSYDVGCLLEEARTEFKGKVELPGTLTCYSL